MRSFPQALAAAARGLRYAARTQRHFRAQLVLAAAAFLFAAGSGMGALELAVLAVTVGMVLGSELLNSAVEMLTDHVHPDEGHVAAAVKDVSAGAVLVCVVLATVVGALLFLPRVQMLSAASARGIPLALGILCLAAFVAGSLFRHRSARP